MHSTHLISRLNRYFTLRLKQQLSSSHNSLEERNCQMKSSSSFGQIPMFWQCSTEDAPRSVRLWQKKARSSSSKLWSAMPSNTKYTSTVHSGSETKLWLSTFALMQSNKECSKALVLSILHWIWMVPNLLRQASNTLYQSQSRLLPQVLQWRLRGRHMGKGWSQEHWIRWTSRTDIKHLLLQRHIR